MQRPPWSEYLSFVRWPELFSPTVLQVLADCVHWPELFQPLCTTLNWLVPVGTQCLMAYEERNAKTEAEFFAMLQMTGFEYRRLGADELDPRYYADDIHVYSITR